MDRRVTPPKRVTSPTWGAPPPCKQALKGILKCEAIDMKMFISFSCKYSTDSITHFEFHKHLGSFWKWEFLELGNYFLSRLSVYLSCARDINKMWACKRRETWGDFQKKRGQKYVSVRSQAIRYLNVSNKLTRLHRKKILSRDREWVHSLLFLLCP